MPDPNALRPISIISSYALPSVNGQVLALARASGMTLRDAGNRAIGAIVVGASLAERTRIAENAAATLDAELTRVDLGRVVSKYIGETEKALEEIFEQAEGHGGVIIFDEADALFGKRARSGGSGLNLLSEDIAGRLKASALTDTTLTESSIRWRRSAPISLSRRNCSAFRLRPRGSGGGR